MTEERVSPRITVLGIGNPFMGDDGVGPAVAHALSSRGLEPDVVVEIGYLAGMGLMRHFLESEVVIVVDAIDAGPGAEAGEIFRFHPDDAGVTQLRSNNIHGMGLGYLLTSARLLGHEPDVLVFGVQVGDVRPEAAMSSAVQRASARVGDLVAEEVARLLTAGRPA